MRTRITTKTYFDAAHRMSPAPEEGYDRWHGHRYEVEVTANTHAWSNLPLDDFRRGVSDILSAYDHRLLTWVGDSEGTEMKDAVVFHAQPTMETISADIYRRISEWLKAEHGLRLHSVRVSSQPDAYVEAYNDRDA